MLQLKQLIFNILQENKIALGNIDAKRCKILIGITVRGSLLKPACKVSYFVQNFVYGKSRGVRVSINCRYFYATDIIFQFRFFNRTVVSDFMIFTLHLFCMSDAVGKLCGIV